MCNLGAWGTIVTYIGELLPSDVRSAGISRLSKVLKIELDA